MILHEQAFEILGLEPTEDGRAIRAAFVRLARIYHPDRFVGMPDDVRVEAERRMKDATTAYETLRDRKKQGEQEAAPAISQKELQERAEQYRVAIAAKNAEEEQARARWRRWDEIERRAREKAEVESQIASMIKNGVQPRVSQEPPGPSTEAGSIEGARTVNPRSSFEERLANARRGVSAPLAPRERAV